MRRNHYTMVARKLIRDALLSASVRNTDPIGVAVSGGADSSALLFGLSLLYRGDRAALVHMITVDHQLQVETAAVSRGVAEFAESLGFQSHIVSIDVKDLGNGPESDARTARYNALHTVAEANGLRAVLLGHTKSDQAEQVLLGILRGSGTRSLSGMARQRGVYLRPFLSGLTRTETVLVCEENDHAYWNDPHNELSAYRRVAVRKLLEATETETGENLIDPLVRTAQISREDADALDFFADQAEESVSSSNWSVVSLTLYPAAVRKRLYRKQLIELGVRSDRVTFEAVDAIEALISDWHGQGSISLSGGITVGRSDGHLIWSLVRQLR